MKLSLFRLFQGNSSGFIVILKTIGEWLVLSTKDKLLSGKVSESIQFKDK